MSLSPRRSGFSKLTLATMLLSTVWNALPATAFAAPPSAAPSAPEVQSMYGFRLTGVRNYAQQDGQPTGEGKFLKGGALAGYPAKACVPIRVLVKNGTTTTQDFTLRPVFDHFSNGIAIDHLETITTTLEGDPAMSADDLNDFAYTGADLSTETKFMSSGGVVGATITGPFAGSEGTDALSARDALGHYDIKLFGMPPSASVYVKYCASLGENLADFSENFVRTFVESTERSNHLDVVVHRDNPTPALANLTLNAIVSGDTAPAETRYTISPAINGVSDFAIFRRAGSLTIPNVPAGTYTITGNQPSNFTFTEGSGTNCSFSGSTATAEIGREDASCTFSYEAPLPLMRVVQEVDNTNGGNLNPDDVPMFVGGASVKNGEYNTYAVAGHLVTEIDPQGYSRIIIGDCYFTGYIELLHGDVKTCILKNTSLPTHLTLTRVIVNDNGRTSTDADFPLSINGIETKAGYAFHVEPGVSTVTVGISDPEAYTASFSGDCDADGHVTLADRDEKACTVTLDDKPVVVPPPPAPEKSTLVVQTVIVNDNAGTKLPEDFTYHVNGTNASQSTLTGSSTDLSVTFDAGEYGLDVADNLGYTKTLGASCTGTAAAGETRTCTVLLNDPAPVEPAGRATLVVKTTVVNDNGRNRDPKDFTANITGGNVSRDSFPGSTVGTTVELDSGSYAVTQVNVGPYLQNFDAGCSGTIAAGETKTCTITNNDEPSPVSTDGAGGGGGGGSSSSGGGSSSGGSSVAIPTSIPTPAPILPSLARVLGESFSDFSSSCLTDEPEAAYITSNPQDLIRNLGLDRDMTMQERLSAMLVQRIITADAAQELRLQVANFTTYGTRGSYRLGAGERAGVVDSFNTVFGRLPKTECEWQDALRIANGKKPQMRNLDREKASQKTFAKIYKRAATSKDQAAIDTMTYGIRPLVRDLAAEKKAILSYRKIFGKIPGNATEWDTVRAMAYAGTK